MSLPQSAFAELEVQPPDVLLSLIKAFEADPRTEKLDLGVGVYRDATGATPVFAAVKEAEERLVRRQVTKAYLGAEGNLEFLASLRTILPQEIEGPDWFALQTPGGTGALRLAAQLGAAARPGATIWLGTPSWPIHSQIFLAAGLAVKQVPTFDVGRQALRLERLLEGLAHARPGDLVLLHGCCHNPTGADPDIREWGMLAAASARRGVLPLVDIAYHGLGDGLDEDIAGLRELLACCSELMIAYSCDKNFGLYRERTGALFVRTEQQAKASSTLLKVAREIWSMPPDHGAAVVAEILQCPNLRREWSAELASMRKRLHELRGHLSSSTEALAAVKSQKGLFAALPLSLEQVEALRRDFAVYMAISGRINVSGLQPEQIEGFVNALKAVGAE